MTTDRFEITEEIPSGVHIFHGKRLQSIARNKKIPFRLVVDASVKSTPVTLGVMVEVENIKRMEEAIEITAANEVIRLARKANKQKE